MKILGWILIIIGAVAGVGIFYLHNKDQDDMAKILVWVCAIALVIGIVLVGLPSILHPTATAGMITNYLG